MDSNKTPTGKAFKGSLGLMAEKGRIKVNFPRQYFGGQQLRKGIGLPDTKEGWAKAELVKAQLELELKMGKLDDGSGRFNELRFQQILQEHGLTAKLRIVKGGITATEPPGKPNFSIMEAWDIYCEYKKPKLEKTTYELMYRGRYLNFLKSAIDAVGEDALEIRAWLLENRNAETVKKILSALDDAYQLLMSQGKISHNPFLRLADDIDISKREKEINPENYKKGDDEDLINRSKAFTWDEAEVIMEYFQNHSKLCHWYPYVAFKFLTGCRTGEAAGLWWDDIKWDKEWVVIRRTYSDACRIFKETKNNTVRRFPMPKDGRLWNLLKSLPQGEPSEVVFETKTGKRILSTNFNRLWLGYEPLNRKGVIPELIEQGLVNKYLSPYNTRHTFITHAIFDLGVPPEYVNMWCEHSEDISKVHYRDTERYAMGFKFEAGSKPSPKEDDPLLERLQRENQELKGLLKNQQEQIERLIKAIENK